MLGSVGAHCRNSPEVGGLVCELSGHQGEVFAHLDPEVGLGDAAVVGVDGVDAGHLPGDHPERRHSQAYWSQTGETTFQWRFPPMGGFPVFPWRGGLIGLKPSVYPQKKSHIACTHAQRIDPPLFGIVVDGMANERTDQAGSQSTITTTIILMLVLMLV